MAAEGLFSISSQTKGRTRPGLHLKKSKEKAVTYGMMGLSSFPSASEGLLPLVAANAALSVSAMKSTLRCVRQLMGSGSPEQGEERDGLSLSWGSRHTGEGCAVCLCMFGAEEQVGILSCGHVFHKGCLLKWFDSQQRRQRRTCPLCRSVVCFSL